MFVIVLGILQSIAIEVNLMQHRNILGMVLLFIFVCVLIRFGYCADPRATKLQRLCSQAASVVESHMIAEGKEGGYRLRIFNQFFGWQRIALAAEYPAEVLLYDQLLEPLAGTVVESGYEPLSKTPDSLVVHLTYGADCGIPPQISLNMKDQTGTGAEIRPQLWSLNDCLIRQIDLGIQQTRADVYATVLVREKATQREGNLYLFLSLSLTENKPGHFQWDQIVKIQRFISERRKAASPEKNEK